MKRIIIYFIAVIMALPLTAQVQNVNKVYKPVRKTENRQEIVIPDVNGFKVLKCDFHIHTVFSDGEVWPTYRVVEAWRDGLDAFAMTDHIEYLPHKQYFNFDFNTSYQIAKPVAERYGIIMIKGTEITRKQGVIGHFNALFIKDANLIPDDDPEKSIANALAQEAFILFNHPGWAVDTCKITEFQQKLIDKKMIHGIEVFNHYEFYPRVVSWCTDMNYPMFANSDEHGIISEDYSSFGSEGIFVRFRPMTLVLAEERSEKAIKEALFARRTIAYFDNNFAAPEQLLKDFYNACIEKRVLSKDEKSTVYTLTNHSSFPFVIRINGGGKLTIDPLSTIRVSVSNANPMKIAIVNMWYREDKHPEI